MREQGAVDKIRHGVKWPFEPSCVFLAHRVPPRAPCTLAVEITVLLAPKGMGCLSQVYAENRTVSFPLILLDMRSPPVSLRVAWTWRQYRASCCRALADHS